MESKTTNMPTPGKPNPAISKVKAKTKHLQAISVPKRPLKLLDLPIDILQLIVKEIKHTNDLAALALTNSALHSLAIPHIYSRFDIVWPDAQVGPSESRNVDALTYGLATLSVGSSFARTVARLNQQGTPQPFKLIDTDYAKYTRKFALGNGPSDWVAEYAVHKESGKMLGTLVAAAVARMKNLDTFYWDMPTGVLARVFESLASLAHQPDNQCKLSRVWVRWHDNSQRPGWTRAWKPGSIANGIVVTPPGSQLTPVGIMLPPNAARPPPVPPVRYADYHCEYPTFSVLPPLKSLVVLDIDEIGYLDEMAVVIERSKDILQELRVSISAKAATQPFAQAWDGPGLRQIDHAARWPGESKIGYMRLGGVLGVLVGRIYDIEKRRTQEKVAVPAIASSAPTADSALPVGQAPGIETASAPGAAQPQQPDGKGRLPQEPGKTQRLHSGARSGKPHGRRRMEGMLKLDILELQRVALCLHVCRHAIDWSILTTLTLLDCDHSDQLWNMLRRQFRPTPVDAAYGTPPRTTSTAGALQYHLALKSIHTNKPSVSLIAVIREALAPNTLEDLFLQDRVEGNPSDPAPITVERDVIFKGAIKRHHASLRRLLLDSFSGTMNQPTRWHYWALSLPMILYITSGRMKNLRELAAAFMHRDWHTFLQRLPNIPRLHAFHLQYVENPPSTPFNPYEMAQQMVNIVALRPEIRLCYIGVGSRCFEIRATRRGYRSLKDYLSYSASLSHTSVSTPLSPAPPGGMEGLAVDAGVGAAADAVGGFGAELDLDDDDEASEGGDGAWTPLPAGSVAGGGVGGGAITGGAPAAPAGGGSATGAAVAAGGDEEESDGGIEDDDEDGNAAATPFDPEETPSEVVGGLTVTSGVQPLSAEAVAALGALGGGGGGVGGGDEYEEDDDDYDEDDDYDNEGGEEEDEDDEDDGFVEPADGPVCFKLREILFYDDKVAIFRARHGRL